MSRDHHSTAPASGRANPDYALSVLAAAAVLVLGLIAAESFIALAIVMMEGTVAWAVLAAAALSGGWLTRWLGLGDVPWSERLILGAGLGIGLLALIVLALGSVGLLTKPAAMALVLVLAVAGAARLILDVRARRARRPVNDEQDETAPASTGRWAWLWLLVVPFMVIALLAACLPPGVLWAEEGFGYDVLEYHLAAPKLWHDVGRITFLPDNVYSNFPLNGEMLSLLMMTLRGDAIEAAYAAQLANVAQAGLLVAAAWLAGRRFSRRAGVVAGVLAASSPWLAYLSGIAYVEPGMLAVGMAALAVLLRITPGDGHSTSRVIVAGLLAGLACGYKYTAVALIAVPLVGMILAQRSSVGTRLKHLVWYALAAGVTFSPWMIRNAVNTGNPVYPLAWSVFGADDGAWDAELEARWQRAHGSAAAEHTSTPPAIRAVQRTIGEPRMGWLVFVLALAGVLAARDRMTFALLVVLALQVIVWLAATHLFARFAVVFLLPLVLLGARVAMMTRRPWPGLLSALLVLGASWNLYHLCGLYYHHTRVGPDNQPTQAYGQTPWFVEGIWPGTEHIGALNRLGPEARVMVVGEARTFYVRRPCTSATAFNHHPLALGVRRDPRPAAVIAWLEQRGTTHLLVHWDELHRLAATYGLDPEIEPALYERLMQAGLKTLAEFSSRDKSPPDATLFEVPRP